MDRDAYFWQVADARLPPPRVAQMLGMKITRVSEEEGVVEAEFDGKPEFTNPVGNVQGGILAAMLDDSMGPALACQLGAGEFAPTLNLNISFLKPAKPARPLQPLRLFEGYDGSSLEHRGNTCPASLKTSKRKHCSSRRRSGPTSQTA